MTDVSIWLAVAMVSGIAAVMGLAMGRLPNPFATVARDTRPSVYWFTVAFLLGLAGAAAVGAIAHVVGYS